MNHWWRHYRVELITLAVLMAFPPLVAGLGRFVDNRWPPLDLLRSFVDGFPLIFVFTILALGLNVVVGYTGLLNLGIAAFFGIGAYVTGILRVPAFPFECGFTTALVASTGMAALAGIVLGAPTLRLRGDYLALVTLGFGEVTRFALRNLEEITAGTRALNPIPPPSLRMVGVSADAWHGPDSLLFYYFLLAFLIAVVLVLHNLERSKLGRAWVALREDELAATCMGINAARVKLSAFAVGAAIAGLAGALYATKLSSTSEPDAFNFSRSISVLCCLILGGLGSIRGVVLGSFLLLGFDVVLAQWLDRSLQAANFNPTGNPLLKFSEWRLMLFGLALILVMRFRPEGLFPSKRVQHELHPEAK